MLSKVAMTLAAAAIASDTPSALRPPQGGQGIGDYSLHDFAAKWMMQQDDIAEIGRYAEANRALRAKSTGRERVILFGDSITAHWDLSSRNDARTHFVNRGIGGQNSSQMLLRFEDDVVDLKPRTVVILAGTNDLRAYVGSPASVGPGALSRIRRNVTAMADIAAARGIRVVLATLPPVGSDRERVARDPAAIRAVNAWLLQFARERRLTVADYHSALAAGDVLPSRFSQDGIHPNSAGYDVMWPVLRAALSTQAS